MSEISILNTKDILVRDENNRAEEKGGDIIESIGRKGVQVPLIVYIDEVGNYVLVAGHRRLKSAVHFGLKTVPVTIIDEKDCDEVRAIENMDRKALHPLDEAEQIRSLQRKGWTNTEIAKVLGITSVRVRKRASLNQLIPQMKDKLRKGEIRLEIAEEIAVLPQEWQKDHLKDAKRFSDATEVRNSYLNSQGFMLNGVVDEILTAEPRCFGCPKNAADDAELFPGTNGSCKDIDCYARKLSKRLEELDIHTLVKDYHSGEIARKVDGVQVAPDYWAYRDERHEKDDSIALSVTGKVLYKRAEKPVQDLRSRQIADDYAKEEGKADDIIEQFSLECANAYMDRTHRKETFPDSSELVKLAQYIIYNETYQIQRILRLSGKDIKTLDNRAKVGVAMILVEAEKLDGLPDVTPSRLYQNSSEVSPPNVMQLPSILGLRTIKAGKRMDNLISKLKALREDYFKAVEEEKDES